MQYFSSPYLMHFAEHIIKKFGKNKLYKKLYIILPNNLACIELRKIFSIHHKFTTMPIIMPFSAMVSSKPETNNSISNLQELLILSKIITDYNSDMSFNISEALTTSRSLSNIFNDLIINNIDIKLIKTYNNSEYWKKIYKFLEYAFKTWQIAITKTGKISKADYQLAALDAKLKKIRFYKQFVVMPDIKLFNPEPLLQKFLQYGILHYVQDNSSDSTFTPTKYINNNQVSKDHKQIPFYIFIHTPRSEISYIECNKNIASKDLLTYTNIIFKTLPNIYEEAQYIAQICKQNLDKKIAIIVNDKSSKRIYSTYLSKDCLLFDDLVEDDLLLTNSCHLIVTISKILSNNFNLKLLFLLLKNPLINSSIIQEIETLLSNNNRFITSISHLLQIIENTGNEELITYSQEKINFLFTYKTDNIFVTICEIAQRFYPDIIQTQSGAKLIEFLQDLHKYSDYITFSNRSELPQILTYLISIIKYYKNIDITNNIIIGNPEVLAFSHFDIVILPNFTTENWPPITSSCPWLSKKAQKLLGLNNTETIAATYFEYFRLLLYNEQIFISHPKKYAGKLTSPSNMLLKLKPNIQYQTHNKNQEQISLDSHYASTPITGGAYSSYFPTILSVTDLEALIKSPYCFYAKKILKLRKKNNLWEEPKVSDFGSFLHKVFEQYSRNYTNNKKINISEIGKDILNRSILPEYTKKTWQMKLIPLIKPFILFDLERRKNSQHIYYELKGELNLEIEGQIIKIIGVADRIEVDKLGKITILDYKTGSVPSIKEVESGLSPQLILESLMILEGGFAPLPKTLQNITIAYVKISASKPYIQTTAITLTIEALKKHKQGLVKLLQYHINNKFFPYRPDLLKYNDYTLLRRY